MNNPYQSPDEIKQNSYDDIDVGPPYQYSRIEHGERAELITAIILGLVWPWILMALLILLGN